LSEKVIDAEKRLRLLNAGQVAEILNISLAMAYRLMQRGDIRTVRIASSRRVRAKDLENYVQANLYPPLPDLS